MKFEITLSIESKNEVEFLYSLINVQHALTQKAAEDDQDAADLVTFAEITKEVALQVLLQHRQELREREAQKVESVPRQYENETSEPPY